MWKDLKIRYHHLLQVFLYPYLNVRQSHLTTIEVILLTYPSLIISNFLWLIFGLSSFKQFLSDHVVMKFIAQNIPGLLLFPLFGVTIYLMFVFVTYPLVVLFSVQLWRWMISFYQKYTGTLISDPTAAHDLAIACQSSNILLIFPFMGSQLAFVASILQLLVGIHHRLKVGYGSALIIVCTPLLLIFFLIFGLLFLFGSFLSAFF